MSRANWAAIVYGRSFHLDFRFITIPEDFASSDLAWASQHILATTSQARNLPNHPRWSLFKNEKHCILGITCMVRDLIGRLGEDGIEVMAKDDHGRPLYLFVGYVTRLKQHKSLLNLPVYTGKQLDAFKPLYRQIERVWLVKDYESASKYPLFSQYQSLNSAIELSNMHENTRLSIQLNHRQRNPEQIFLWPDTQQQNNLLWLAAAKCSEATSVCLAVKGKILADSPFLNQTTTQVKEFTIGDRFYSNSQNSQSSSRLTVSNNHQATNSSSPLSQKIALRAKEDLNLTWEQGIKMATASQELINQISSLKDSRSKSNNYLAADSDKPENYGFKTRESQTPLKKQGWF